jgi:hypothetical protein
MRQGLIAHWRRGMATRGLVGSGLLALPVAAALMIGFGGGFGGVAEGLSAISGPSASSVNAPPPPVRGEEPLELAATELSTPTGSAAAADAAGGAAGEQNAGGQGSGDPPEAAPSPVAGSDPSVAIGGGGEVSGAGDGGSTGGGGGEGGLGINLPPSGGGTGGGGGAGDAVGGIVDGVGQTVDGVLGGRN